MTNLVVIPGERLGNTHEYQPGQGVYVINGHIYSSLCGERIISDTGCRDAPILDVVRKRGYSLLPHIGDMVTCSVVSCTSRLAKCKIICVNDHKLAEPFKAIIRKEDVRAAEKDKVDLSKCFRHGDLVLARVLNVSDYYLLTTSGNELGVVMATSQQGNKMIPISWCEMMDQKTLQKEPRKVAKVQPHYVVEI